MKFNALAICLISLAGIVFCIDSPLSAKGHAEPKGHAETKPLSKKGIGIVIGKNSASEWKEKVADLKVNWHYSWGSNPPSQEPEGVQFVPMIWGYKSKNNKLETTLDDITANKSKHASNALLGFNEPDNQNQSHLSVDSALQAWPTLMKSGLKLGSPACVNAEGEWMRDFMKQADEKKYRVDFVTVHWYGGPSAKAFIAKLKNIHELYDKPIWITEFAVADWKAKTVEDNRHTPQEVRKFMKEILPELDHLGFVERYAWFSGSLKSPKLTSSALFDEDGKLTELGKIYADHVSETRAK